MGKERYEVASTGSEGQKTDMRPASGAGRRTARASDDARAGFALVLAIWGLGLVSLMALVVIAGARDRVLVTANMIDAAKAEAFADAAIELARLEIARAGDSRSWRFSPSGAPALCRLRGKTLVAIVVEDEDGKVDLNGASPHLLRALFAGFGASSDEAERLARSVRVFSSAGSDSTIGEGVSRDYAADGRPYGPKGSQFETALELDQVLGVTPEIFRVLAPYVTTSSHHDGLDPLVAPPALVAALAGGNGLQYSRWRRPGATLMSTPSGFPMEFVATSPARQFLIHAEAMTASGAVFAREALVEVLGVDPIPAVREWRTGEASILPSADLAGAAGWARC